MNTQKQYDKINEEILMVCSIVCTKCKTVRKEYERDEHYFTQQLIDEGWVYKKHKVLCNRCTMGKG